MSCAVVFASDKRELFTFYITSGNSWRQWIFEFDYQCLWRNLGLFGNALDVIK